MEESTLFVTERISGLVLNFVQLTTYGGWRRMLNYQSKNAQETH